MESNERKHSENGYRTRHPLVISIEGSPGTSISGVSERISNLLIEAGELITHLPNPLCTMQKDSKESSPTVNVMKMNIEKIFSDARNCPPYNAGSQIFLSFLMQLNYLSRFANESYWLGDSKKTQRIVITGGTLSNFIVSSCIAFGCSITDMEELLTQFRNFGVLSPIHRQCIIFVHAHNRAAYINRDNDPFNVLIDNKRKAKNRYREFFELNEYDRIITHDYNAIYAGETEEEICSKIIKVLREEGYDSQPRHSPQHIRSAKKSIRKINRNFNRFR